MTFSDIPLPSDAPSAGVKHLTAQLSAIIASTGKAPPGPPPGKPPMKKFKQYFVSKANSGDSEANSLMMGNAPVMPFPHLDPVQTRIMSMAGQPIPGQPMRPLRGEEPLPPGVAPPQLPPPMMPPPGMMIPPHDPHFQDNSRVGGPPGAAASSVFSAPPSIIEKTPAITIKHQPTIQAKPQINPALKAASTQFVPTALKVRRESVGHKVRSASEIAEAALAASKVSENKPSFKATSASKDEIYQQFLAEVNQLL